MSELWPVAEARDVKLVPTRVLGILYGDNVFKKNGINRDGAGKHKKTRHFGGKQGAFSRDRPQTSPALSNKLRWERR